MTYSKRDWERKIRKIAVATKHIFFTEHALSQMRARKITQSVVLDVLKNGKISIEPEPDIKTGHTKCRMERFSAGKLIAAVVACEHENTNDCLVITAFVIRN